MKVSIKKNQRKCLVIVIFVLMLGSLIMAGFKLMQPLKIQKEVPQYKYSQQAQVDYQVLFSNNKFFPENTAGPGRGYLTPITDSLQTKFHYQYNGAGEQTGSVDGTYTVSAAVTGYTLQDSNSSQEVEKKKVKVWEKTTILVPPTPFVNNKDKAEIDIIVPVDVRGSKQFADQVNEEYKSAVDVVELSVNYNVAIKVNAAQKIIQDQIAPVLVIPLKGNSFIVGGKTSDKNEKTINAMQTIDVSGVKVTRTVYITLFVILAVLLVLILLFTDVEVEDPLRMELKRIMKRYGDRIIACDGASSIFSDAPIFTIDSMDDLIKAGDELQKPVLYENTGNDKYNFSIIHENIIYTYTLDTDSLNKKPPSDWPWDL